MGVNMLCGFSNIMSKILDRSGEYSDPEWNKSIEKHPRESVTGTLSPIEEPPKFWVENDKEKSIQLGEKFSMVIKRDSALDRTRMWVTICVYQVLPAKSSPKSTYLAEGWDGLLVGNKVLYWSGNGPAIFHGLYIQSPGDFRIRVTIAERRSSIMGNARVADFYSAIIHRL
ncbi:hypothetical protein F5Y11DRAFT_346262 [Daldinia sp. FL1419]|nr:hypothetical protein F5Y11DRAFT_346262 [Daldinia sp. FL1419]